MNVALRTPSLAEKFWRVLTTQPIRIFELLRRVLLFRRTRILGKFIWTPAAGFHFGRNVRVQRLRCLIAERPDAEIHLGDHDIVYENARIEAYGHGQIHIGKHSIIGDARIYCRSKIHIGQRVITSWNVFLQDYDPHPISVSGRARQIRNMAESFVPSFDGHNPRTAAPDMDRIIDSAPIWIGDDVWIGANVTILKGANIGSGCIVATGSVVTQGDYPERSVLGGVPAKVIRKIEETENPS